MAERIQRKRTKGWKMPPNTVYVGRPSRFGNPAIATSDKERIHAVAWFRAHILPHLDVSALRGKNLACWCRLDQPCHADVLLEAASG